MRIDVLVDVKTTLGEGPLWDVQEQRLYWVDSFDGRVFRCTEDGREIRAWDVPQKIGSMCLRRGGGAVVSLQRGFHALDFQTGEVALIHDPEPDLPKNRLNDGKVDRQGRFLAGSMDTMEEGANAALYRLDPDLSVHKLQGSIICSNGPCWSPDGRTFYFADTWVGEIGPTTTTPPLVPRPTVGPSPRSTCRAGVRPTARRSMRKGSSGTYGCTMGRLLAMRQTVRSTG